MPEGSPVSLLRLLPKIPAPFTVVFEIGSRVTVVVLLEGSIFRTGYSSSIFACWQEGLIGRRRIWFPANHQKVVVGFRNERFRGYDLGLGFNLHLSPLKIFTLNPSGLLP